MNIRTIHYGFFRHGLCVFLSSAMFIVGCRKEDEGKTTAESITSASEWFTDITQDVGLDFIHESGAAGKHLLPEIMGSGVAMFDYDNDGDLDIYFTTGHKGLPEFTANDAPSNRLYRQMANGMFQDVTEQSGLGDKGYGMGVAIGDMDNDGYKDVYVSNYGPDHLYRNRGDGTFEDITISAGIRIPGWSCSTAFLDYDRDGFLDIFITQYVNFKPNSKCYDRTGHPDYCGPKGFAPVHDILLRNNGDRTFTDVTAKAGIDTVKAAGLGVVYEDFNNDGWIDLYVANDQYANHLWINNRDGTFHDDAMMLGAALNLHGQEEAGMGIVAADFDNDTFPDLFLTHLVQETNTLYHNLGNGLGFSDVTSESGLGWSSFSYTGFGTAAFDVELDGDLDIVVANGRVRRTDPLPDARLPAPWHIFAEPNLFYLNDGGGRFSSIHDRVSAFTHPIEISRGLCTGDIDADGDLDVLITNIQGPARLYRNDAPRKGHWLKVRAFDPRYHRDAIGAMIRVHCKDQRFVRTIRSAYSYMSAGEPVAHFGLGSCTRIDPIEVYWPDGFKERFNVETVDQSVKLIRGQGKPLP